MRTPSRQNSRRRQIFLLGLAASLAAGCSKRSEIDPGWAEVSKGPATYEAITSRPSTNMPRVRPMLSNNRIGTVAPFALFQTQLSPAALIHCESRELNLFAHLRLRDLGAPSYAAFGANGGPRIVTNGHPADVSQMNECWVLVWFAGAPGWTNWDSPWAVFLQHKPATMTLDTNGLRFEFAGGAGDVAVMPLYGYFKPPAQGSDSRKRHEARDKKIETWRWSEVLPREPLMRLRYWAGVLREFPIYCEDSFSVDRTKGTVTIRQRFAWHSIGDDWNTKHLKLAPLSPSLALAALPGKSPIRFSGAVVDLDLPTPYGPYAGIEGVDTHEAIFSVLARINLTEAPPVLPLTNAGPAVAGALSRLQIAARELFWETNRHGDDRANISGCSCYAKALPYVDPSTRSNMVTRLRRSFSAELSGDFQLPEVPGANHSDRVVHRSGTGAKLAADLLEALWAYVHFTADWELVKERWPRLRMLLRIPAETSWAGFGQEARGAPSEGDGPSIALARLAYGVGDVDTYNYACYLAAHELTQHSVEQVGVDYFRRYQPWRSKQFLSNETAAVLVQAASSDPAFGPPCGVIASCLAVLRSDQPPRWERLIPDGEPSPFVAGLEREIAGPRCLLLQEIRLHEVPITSTQPHQGTVWPEIIWGEDRKSPRAEHWSFGWVFPGNDLSAAKRETMSLNWNTQILVFRP